MTNIFDRFWSKVDMSGCFNTSCWEWKDATTEDGYGQFSYEGSHKLAHRVALALETGFDIDSNYVVRHTCDNPSCVNPYHLEIGTQLDNIQDRHHRGRDNLPKGERKMPCYDSRNNDPEYVCSGHIDRLCKTESLLCSACRVLTRMGYDFDENPRLSEWWEKHKEEDKEKKTNVQEE